VISAVRDLNRTELAGEAVRAALEALTCAAPHQVAQVLDVPGFSRRYGARIDTWRLPSSKTKRDQLATDFARDGFALLGAVYDPACPAWLRQIPAVQVVRIVLVQNYTRTTGRNGREVVKRREADVEGLPPGHLRLSSPYDLDARWGVTGEMFWNGFKIHVSETCTDAVEDDREHPNLITDVATTDATVPEVKALEGIHAQLERRGVLPAEHYVDLRLRQRGTDRRVTAPLRRRADHPGTGRHLPPGSRPGGLRGDEVHHRLEKGAGGLPAGTAEFLVEPLPPAW
jgi:hypothetical protein